jgi:hypothetical protein
MIEMIPSLDEVEALDVRGKEVNGEDYNLPLAKALKAVEFDSTLSVKAWTDEGLEEVITLLDLSDEHNITDEHKRIFRSRDLQLVKEALAEEAEAAGVPKGFFICWALVRI